MNSPTDSQMVHHYRGLHCLITGGLGFIGSNLALTLATQGAKVTVVDSSIQGCGANKANLADYSSFIHVIEGDIADAARWGSDLDRPDVIFNVAGEISHSMSMSHPDRDLEINTRAQLHFLRFCRDMYPGVRIVYAGTRQLYGKPRYLPVDELHPIEPIDFNGIHKNATCQYHLLMARRGELDCVILRLSNVYGPRMALHLPQQGVLNLYLRNAVEGKPLSVYGDGAQLRDPVYVDDAVDAFLRAGFVSKLESRVYNIGGPFALALSEIAATIARLARRPAPVHVPFPEIAHSIDIGSYVTDWRRANEELGWEPTQSFEAGIKNTLSYYAEAASEYLPKAIVHAGAEE